MISNYEDDFLNNQLIPALGSYLGEVLVNTFKGKWIFQDKLMQCRIESGQRLINPFRYAFNVIYLKHRLIEEFYNIEVHR